MSTPQGLIDTPLAGGWMTLKERSALSDIWIGLLRRVDGEEHAFIRRIHAPLPERDKVTVTFEIPEIPPGCEDGKPTPYINVLGITLSHGMLLLPFGAMQFDTGDKKLLAGEQLICRVPYHKILELMQRD